MIEGHKYRYVGGGLAYYNSLVTLMKKVKKNGREYFVIKLNNGIILPDIPPNDLRR
jgi:hypothetical protein